jgi:hypothetical protein
VDFGLISESLLEAARRQGLPSQKQHVHPERLAGYLPLVEEGRASVLTPGRHVVKVAVVGERGLRTASFGSAVLVAEAHGPQLYLHTPEGLHSQVASESGMPSEWVPVEHRSRVGPRAPGTAPPESSGVLSRSGTQALRLALEAEVARLRGEALAARELMGEAPPADQVRFGREAGAYEATAGYLERTVVEPLRSALRLGEPVPARGLRAQLARFEGLKLNRVEVGVRTQAAMEILDQVPESSPAGASPARAEALAFLRQQAFERKLEAEGPKLMEAYRALLRAGEVVEMADILARPEIAALSEGTRAAMTRQVEAFVAGRAPGSRVGEAPPREGVEPGREVRDPRDPRDPRARGRPPRVGR